MTEELYEGEPIEQWRKDLNAGKALDPATGRPETTATVYRLAPGGPIASGFLVVYGSGARRFLGMGDFDAHDIGVPEEGLTISTDIVTWGSL